MIASASDFIVRKKSTLEFLNNVVLSIEYNSVNTSTPFSYLDSDSHTHMQTKLKLATYLSWILLIFQSVGTCFERLRMTVYMCGCTRLCLFICACMCRQIVKSLHEFGASEKNFNCLLTFYFFSHFHCQTRFFFSCSELKWENRLKSFILEIKMSTENYIICLFLYFFISISWRGSFSTSKPFPSFNIAIPNIERSKLEHWAKRLRPAAPKNAVGSLLILKTLMMVW